VDREIAANVQRRTRLKQVATLVLPLVLLVGAIAWLPSWLRPTLSASRLRTAVVTAGPIDASISAAGLVVPAFERVLSSPLDARVLRILKRPGAVLAAGDAVLELDVSESAQALARAESDLKIKHNEQLRTRLGYEKSLVDLDGQMEVKTLEIQTRRATLDIHQQLAARGLLSQEELRKTALALRQAEVELAQLQNTRLSAGRTTDVQLEGLALERATLSRDVAERRRLLDLATTKSDRAGVLTWVVADEGVLVRRGDVIARIADLSAFRIDATVSDIHAGTIRTGLPVVIRIDERQFQGSVQEVYPTVENGAIRFMVAIDDAGDAALRPSLRADVQVITARRAETLKVQRGVFADGTGPRQVFVRNGNRAVRTTVELGVASFDEVEILSGLAPGDEVILTDMRDYEHLSEFRIR
jgi:HlyD family secretion protein